MKDCHFRRVCLIIWILFFSVPSVAIDVTSLWKNLLDRFSAPADCHCNTPGTVTKSEVTDEDCKKPGYGFGEYTLKHGMEDADPQWTVDALKSLPKIWNTPQITYGSPEFKKEFFKRYGLSYPSDSGENNNDLPLGLLKTKKDYVGGFQGSKKPTSGITISCSACHESMVFGNRYPASNPFFNAQRLFGDLDKAQGKKPTFPFSINPTKQNSMVNAADHIGLLEALYAEGTAARLLFKVSDGTPVEKHYEKEVPYLKTPPWFDFPIKAQNPYGFYYDGLTPQSFNFAEATYSALFKNKNDLKRALDEWNKCARSYLLQLEPPKYPFNIDLEKAGRGINVFNKNCAQCHGVYSWPKTSASPMLSSYPADIVAPSTVGTNPLRALFSKNFPITFTGPGIDKLPAYQAAAKNPGYVAPPLAGIWVRAPYTHTGGVISLRELLFVPPEKRTKGFVLKADPSNPNDFDQKNVGWKVQKTNANTKPGEFDRVYDPTQGPSLGNGGHPFGLKITDPTEQNDLLEFLKSL